MTERRGFIDALFDFSFSSFITPRIIAVVYGILIFFAFLGAISMATTVNAMSNFLFALVAFPVVFALGVLAARIYMEIIIVMFKIAEHTGDTARNTAAQRAQTPAGY